MKPYYERSGITIFNADCADALARLPISSAHALVTDPPSGISFMGRDWDGDRGGRDAWIEWMALLFIEARRVLLPGAHALVWALPRTSHWTATALEDAGFAIRDVGVHLFGQGFPKSHNLGGEWQGWGTALKPAAEHWILARAPMAEKNVAANVQRFGTGAINVDGCRIGEGAKKWATPRGGIWSTDPAASGVLVDNPQGRWPANVTLDEDAAAALDAQTGTLTSGYMEGEYSADSTQSVCYGSYGKSWRATYGDSGGASRFFYVAKASRAERNRGLEALPLQQSGMVSNTSGQHITRRDGGAPPPAQNPHPTVKPLALMRYLCRLVTPPGGVVLDPFAGSGTTGCAAVAEGFGFVGIEQSADYCEIAARRLAACTRQGVLALEAVV